MNKPETDPKARRPIPVVSTITKNARGTKPAPPLRWVERSPPDHWDRNAGAGGGLLPAVRPPRSARGVGTNGAPPQPTRDARGTHDPLAATFDTAQGQADGHPCAFRAPVSKPRTARQCMPKAAMNLICRTTCSPLAKSRRVADRMIGDAAKLPRETPARETGRRLAKVTEEHRIW